jgi:hypothetical protein
MRAFMLLTLTAAGCTVDVGAGSFGPVAIDTPIDVAEAGPPLSLSMDIEFLSADDSKTFADQYGGKLGAVNAIDIAVQALAVDDGSGAPVSGGSLSATFEGVTIDHAGQRVRLPDATKMRVLTAIAQRAAISFTVDVIIDWSLPSPPAMDAHALLQPIVVVDALKAL